MIRRLEKVASKRALRAVGGRRVVGAFLLLGFAALVLGNAVALYEEEGPRRYRLALSEPASLHEHFEGSRQQVAVERFAFYELAARFEGAQVLMPKPLAKRHRWYLERVGRVRVDSSSAKLPAPRLTDKRPADFAGRLDGRPVQFWREPGADYALVESAPQGPLLWVPRQWVEPER